MKHTRSQQIGHLNRYIVLDQDIESFVNRSVYKVIKFSYNILVPPNQLIPPLHCAVFCKLGDSIQFSDPVAALGNRLLDIHGVREVPVLNESAPGLQSHEF